MPNYSCWTKHGERGVTIEDNEEEEDDNNYPEFPEYGDTFMGEADTRRKVSIYHGRKSWLKGHFLWLMTL
jgi:hypothetical protein